MYSGPSMEIYDLAKPQVMGFVNSISQSKYSEFDKSIKCKDYPYNKYDKEGLKIG